MAMLDGKTVLVTGASKGIGAAIAAAAGREGAHVILHYGRDREGAAEAGRAIPEARRLLLPADFEDPAAVADLWRMAHRWRGRVDVLVNNAALLYFDGGVEADDARWQEVWTRTMAVNVHAPALLMREAARAFMREGGGDIITLSSWTAQRGAGDPGAIAYAASKAAIRNATQTIARSYAKEGVRAYVIAPGVVRTRMSEEFARLKGGEDKVSAGLASGEWVNPAEVAETVCFLASGRAPQLSGATLDMNGASYIR